MIKIYCFRHSLWGSLILIAARSKEEAWDKVRLKGSPVLLLGTVEIEGDGE